MLSTYPCSKSGFQTQCYSAGWELHHWGSHSNLIQGKNHTLVLIFPWWSINSSLLFIYFLYFQQSADSPRAWLWKSPKGSIYEKSKPKGREELVDIPMTISCVMQTKMEVVRNILLWMMIQNKIVKAVLRKCEITSYWKISSVGVKVFCRSAVMQQIFLTDKCHNKSF